MLVSFIKRATDTLREVVLWYAVMLIAVALLFSYLEGYSFLDSLYWAGTTATSTGYGDISPKTAGGKLLALFTMHTIILFVGPLVIIRLIELVNEDRHQWTDEEQCKLQSDVEEIKQRLKNLTGR